VANISKENEKHTILFIGDSHIRGCVSMVTDELNKNYSVTGIVKPGPLLYNGKLCFRICTNFDE